MEEKFTMAEAMAEIDRREKEEEIRQEQLRLQRIEERKQERIAEKERKHQEYLAEKERKHQEYLAEKERKHQEYLAEKERRENSDETRVCTRCGQEFIFTAGEKKFFKEKGFFKPSLCKECKSKQKIRVTFHN